MHGSDAPVYQTAVDLRLLYALSDLMVVHFRFRKLLWRGEKAAIRYWQCNDPAYFDTFVQRLGVSDREQKFRLYERLATLAAAPAGGIWEDGTTAMSFTPESELRGGMIEDSLEFWESLISC